MSPNEPMAAWLYIMTNKKHGTLYVGVTGDLVRRVYEHREKLNPNSFTAQYDLTRLVHFEEFGSFELAERRERNLKKWLRNWKVSLIEERNPYWDDLWPLITQ